MPVNSFDSYPLSWKPDKSKLQSPLYKSLALDLENKIKSGELKEGTKLPPQREIADYLDIDYTTITRTYNLCKQKGLLYGIGGKGTFVANINDTQKTISILANSEESIELGSIDAFDSATNLVEKACKEVITKGYLKSLYQYSYPLGHPHHINAALRWLEQLKVNANKDNIAILSGAQNALTVALVSLFNPNDKIAVDQYTYCNFIELAKLLHLQLIPINCDVDGMLASDLKKQCKIHNIKGIYLIPTCSNPTTITIPLRRRKELVEVIKNNNLILLEDDVATWLYAGSNNVIDSMYNLLDGNSIYICGMTKSLCPGLRVAYMCFADKYKDKIVNGLVNVNIKTSSLDSEIISQLILNGNGYQIVKKKCNLTKKNCAIYQDIFNDYINNFNPLSYYQWLEINTDKDANEIEDELLALGINVYHSKRFSVQDNKTNYLRISMCSEINKQKFTKGLNILKDYLVRNKYL